ncbi:MAG TPA: histidine kinase [Nitrospiria bacterium]|nr:histidine kinase [Nitrospiria bacterium]
MIKVAIIGAGRGGTSLIDILHNDPFVKIIGVAEIDRNAPGIKLAQKFGIPITTRYTQFLNSGKADIIIDVTGNQAVERTLLKQAPAGVSVIGGSVAKFMWQLIDEQIRSKQETERHLLEYQSLYQLYMSETRHAISEERTRLAMDIHDGLVQTLVGLNYKLDLCEELLHLNPPAGLQSLKETKTLLKNAIEEAREVIFNLKPIHMEKMDLVPALKHHLKTFERQYRIVPELKVVGSEKILLPRSKIFLFRIIQEALSNVHKHSKAKQVRIRLQIGKNHLKTIVTDDGVGFDMEEVAKDPEKWASFGLKGIQERARLLGGTTAVSSKVNHGTTVTVRIPLPEKEPKILETKYPEKDTRSDR